MFATTRTDRRPSQTLRRSLLASLLGAGVLLAAVAPNPALASTPSIPGWTPPADSFNPQQTTQVYQNPANTRMLNPQPLPPKQFAIPGWGR